MDEIKQAPGKEKIKKKGFIRWEAILPISVIIALVASYFILLFDSHLKKAIEFIGYSAMGAEVNVASLKSSFFNAGISIKGIQFTNSEKPTHNLIKIGEIKFGMSWDALLRGKLLIEIASIEQIQFDSPRTKPGRVKPPEPVSNEPSIIEKEGQKLAKQALDATKEEYNDNVLGDIAALMAGGNSQEQLKNLEGQLKSKAKIAELQKELATKQTEWNGKIKNLPQQKEIAGWNERFKKIKTKDFKTPQELQESLTQFQKLIQEINTKAKEVEKSGQKLSADFKYFETQSKEVEKLVQSDIKDLEAHFKLPKLNAQALTHSLFKKYAGPYLAQFNKYQKLAHKYLPPNLLKKKGDKGPAEEDIQIQPRAREHGISYEFGKPNSYPFFWLKKALISSKATPGVPTLGNLTGEVLNVTSNQSLTRVPTQINFNGDFPELAINGIDAQLTLNHIHQPYKETFNAKVASYPVDKKMLVSSKDVELGFQKAVGSTLIKANYSDSLLEFSISNAYKQLDYIVSASNKEVDGVLKSIMSGIPMWTIDASGSGVFPNLPIELKSNLGKEMARGLERILQQKIEEARAKIKKIIDEAIGKEKAKLEEEFNKAKSQAEGEIKKVQETLDKQKSEMEAKAEEAKKEESKKAQKQIESELKKHLPSDAQKKLDELKKKIKF